MGCLTARPGSVVLALGMKGFGITGVLGSDLGNIRIILGLYGDTGKENGNYNSGLRV